MQEAEILQPGWFTNSLLYNLAVGISFLLLLPEGWSQSPGRVQWLETAKLGSKLLRIYIHKSECVVKPPWQN